MAMKLIMVIGSSTNRYTLTQKALSMYCAVDQWVVVANGEKTHHYAPWQYTSPKNINTIIAVSTIHSPSQWLRYIRRLGYVAATGAGARLIETKLYHNSVTKLHISVSG